MWAIHGSRHINPTMTKIITKRVEVHVFKKTKRGHKFLVLKRSPAGKYPNLWQMVSGTIDPGEKAYETAIREVKEETQLDIEELFILPRVTEFYDFFEEDSINLVPVFIARVKDDEVKISDEHSEFKWVYFHKAYRMLHWIQWKENVVFTERILKSEHLYNSLQKIEIK